jgi:hypothetical protein
VIKRGTSVVENVGELFYHQFRIGRDGDLTYDLVVHVEDGVEPTPFEFETSVVGDVRSSRLNWMVENLGSLLTIFTSSKVGLCVPLLLEEGEILLREGYEFGKLSIAKVLPACSDVDRDFKPPRSAGGSESVSGSKNNCLRL